MTADADFPMDSVITAAVPLSGSYLFCAAAETVSRNCLFPSHIGGQNACFALFYSKGENNERTKYFCR